MWEFEKLISDIANSKTTQTVFGNPIYSAIIIVSMVLLIIYFTARNEITLQEDSEYSMAGLMFTTGIYCIITVLTLVYLQDKSIRNEYDRRYDQRTLNNVVSGTLGGTVAPPVDIYNPVPALLEGAEEEEYYASKKKKKLKPSVKPVKKPTPEPESEPEPTPEPEMDEVGESDEEDE